MGFLDIAINKTSRTASARASLAALKRRRRLTYFSQIDRLPPVFGLVFRRNSGIARGTDTLWSSS